MPMASAFSTRSPRIHRPPGGPEKTLYPPFWIDRAQAAGGAFGNGRHVAHHHARHPASGHVEHLLWAMDAGKDRDFRASNRGPLPIMKSPRARNSRPWRRPGAFSSEIEARPPGNLHRPEEEIFGRAQHQNAEQFSVEFKSSGSRVFPAAIESARELSSPFECYGVDTSFSAHPIAMAWN
jgi:hypothetical protein